LSRRHPAECFSALSESLAAKAFENNEERKNMIAQKMPKLALIALTLGILCFNQPLSAAAKHVAKSSGKAAAETQKANRADGGDETAVRAQLAQLSRALAEGDARALAALWSEDGDYTDSDGALSKGRSALEKRFAAVFSKEGKQQVELLNESLKTLAANVVSVEGTVRRKDAPGGPTPETRYSIVFVKQNGNWLIATASETPLLAETKTDPLNELAWLVGEWSAEQDGASVKMRADWAANKNFITCQYETRKSADSPQMESRQVIGWDPRSGEPISWHFDSAGGFGWGNWIKKDRQWLVEATGVDRDGSTNTATNVISITDSNNFSWQSINRSVNGVPFNDANPLKVHRVVK
jgi:uncharacterized protein (TIGR02246 family)